VQRRILERLAALPPPHPAVVRVAGRQGWLVDERARSSRLAAWVYDTSEPNESQLRVTRLGLDTLVEQGLIERPGPRQRRLRLSTGPGWRGEYVSV